MGEISFSMSNDLVSIIMLSRDRGRFVEESVRSILAQTFTNWELLFFDVNSKDDTASKMMPFMEQDSRIHVSRMPYQKGMTIALNKALNEAKGRWMAFLKSGDTWEPEKLERQIAFMEINGYHFSYTKFLRHRRQLINRQVVQSGPRRLTYKDMEKCCWLGNLTVMYDAKTIGQIQIQDFKHNNYYASWLKVSEKVDCYLLPECLAKLRTPHSTIMEYLLTDKLNWRYRVYRWELGKNPFVAIWMTLRCLYYASLKRVKYVERV